MTMDTRTLAGKVRETLRHGPAEAVHVARRKAGQAAKRPVRRIWGVTAPRLARLIPADRVATAAFLAVADGHTLNLHLLLPEWIRPLEHTLELEFARKASRIAVPLAVTAGLEGTANAAGTFVLGSLPGRLDLSRGVWRLSIVARTANGEPRRLAVYRPGPLRPETGPTLAAPRCPDTGQLFRTGTNALGRCQLTVRDARPRAEVVSVGLTGTELEIVGRFVAVPGTDGVVAAFSLRGDETRHTVDVTLDAGRFRVRAPLAAMVPAGLEQVWDLHVHTADGARLRVGRYLHDLRNPRAVLRIPERRVVVADGVGFHVRPYYTPAGSLALACSRPDGAAR